MVLLTQQQHTLRLPIWLSRSPKKRGFPCRLTDSVSTNVGDAAADDDNVAAVTVERCRVVNNMVRWWQSAIAKKVCSLLFFFYLLFYPWTNKLSKIYMQISIIKTTSNKKNLHVRSILQLWLVSGKVNKTHFLFYVWLITKKLPLFVGGGTYLKA